MKVLQINCVYKKGSTGKITEDIHHYLTENGVDSIVCYGRGERVKEKNVYKVCSELRSNINHFLSKFTGIVYAGNYSSNRKIIKIIKKEKPDIVHLQCMNGYFVNLYRLIKWLKINKIKTVLTLHAEFMYTGGCGYAFECEQWMESPGCVNCSKWKVETGTYLNRTSTMWKKMYDAFDGFDKDLIVVSVSPWLMERAKQSTIFKDKENITVLNGLNDEVFSYRPQEELRKKLNLSNQKIVFHATPYFDLSPNNIKGGRHVVELAKKMSNQNIVFIVAGRYDKKMEVPKNMILLGQLENQYDLASYYSLADITLLTSEKETFSMVTAESLCCGTPVVGFKAGAPEGIALKEYSQFVEYGDLESLEKELIELIDISWDKNEISEQAKIKYSKKKMGENYLRIYEELVSKGK